MPKHRHSLAAPEAGLGSTAQPAIALYRRARIADVWEESFTFYDSVVLRAAPQPQIWRSAICWRKSSTPRGSGQENIPNGPEISAAREGLPWPASEPIQERHTGICWRPRRACGHHRAGAAVYQRGAAGDGHLLAGVSPSGSGPGEGSAGAAVSALRAMRAWPLPHFGRHCGCC